MLEYEVPMFAATAPNKLLFPPVGKLRHWGRDSDASQMVNIMLSWKFYFRHLLVIVNSSVRASRPSRHFAHAAGPSLHHCRVTSPLLRRAHEPYL